MKSAVVLFTNNGRYIRLNLTGKNRAAIMIQVRVYYPKAVGVSIVFYNI